MVVVGGAECPTLCGWDGRLNRSVCVHACVCVCACVRVCRICRGGGGILCQITHNSSSMGGLMMKDRGIGGHMIKDRGMGGRPHG